jgi:hypothetical protein
MIYILSLTGHLFRTNLLFFFPQGKQAMNRKPAPIPFCFSKRYWSWLPVSFSWGGKKKKRKRGKALDLAAELCYNEIQSSIERSFHQDYAGAKHDR